MARLCSSLLLPLLAALTAMPAAAIVLGQIDDFETLTTQNWSGGANPTNIPNGGPDGSGDAYLQITPSGTGYGPLGTYNQTQWTGDYTAAGVGRISFDLNNFGPSPVALRISILTTVATFTTTNEVVLPPNSGWVTAEFLLDPVAMTRTGGTGTFAQAMANVGKLLIRHDPDPISPSGQRNGVAATLGIDNVTALPEPGLVGALAAGSALLAAWHRALA
jgi:hypothetical protein